MFNTNKPLVGIHSISSVTKYYSDERTSMMKRGLTVDEIGTKISTNKIVFMELLNNIDR